MLIVCTGFDRAAAWVCQLMAIKVMQGTIMEIFHDSANNKLFPGGIRIARRIFVIFLTLRRACHAT